MAFGFRGKREWLRAGDSLTNGWAEVEGPFRRLTVIFSDGEGWEHVSVSTRGRCPNWDEMRFIKDLYWSADDVVMQLHPGRAEYVNNHPYCLHLWRPQGQTIPTPPPLLVGVRW
jgi:hypothetical protein